VFFKDGLKLEFCKVYHFFLKFRIFDVYIYYHFKFEENSRYYSKVLVLSIIIQHHHYFNPIYYRILTNYYKKYSIAGFLGGGSLASAGAASKVL
jgi:hypothetical protein